MANAYEMFETDEKLEQDGITLDYGEFKIRVAHAGGSNKKFSKLLDARLKPYERQMKNKTMDDDVAAQLMREVYAKTIVLDFFVKDPKDKKGETFIQGVPKKGGHTPFDEENVVRIFKELPRLFQDVQSQAQDFALYRAAELEEKGKN